MILPISLYFAKELFGSPCQNSRAMWLKDGDRNFESTLTHMVVTQKRSLKPLRPEYKRSNHWIFFLDRP